MSKRYNVGFGKPPVHSRFRSGQSGNPAGRARRQIKGPSQKVMNVKQAVIDALNMPVSITEGGKKKDITALEALVRSSVMHGIQGDKTMTKLLLTLASSFTIDDFARETLFKFRERNGQFSYYTQSNMDAFEELAAMVDEDSAREALAGEDLVHNDMAEPAVAEAKTEDGNVAESNDKNSAESPNETMDAPNDELRVSGEDECLTCDVESISEEDGEAAESDADPSDDIQSDS
jgi:hypothetical protein